MAKTMTSGHCPATNLHNYPEERRLPDMAHLTYTALQDLPPVLTADEVASVLRIPKSSVYDLASRGKLPCVKLGRTWRMSKAALVEFLCGR